MRQRLIFGVPALGVLVALFFWLTPTQTSGLALHLDEATVASGQALYLENCAACHGVNLEGQADWQSRDADGYLPAPPHDETGHTWHHPTDQLFAITKLGTEAIVGGGYKSNMGAFGDVLSDDEIYAVLAYIKSTWPNRIIERHNQMDASVAAAKRP
ncbi:MAG: cytochrome c [Boseongicola sp.]|nr:cytochrome c [Boseongicola sp.]